MTREEVIDIIRAEVGKQLLAILTGQSKNAAEGREDIALMYPNAPPIEKRPVMHPYGLKSRAKEGVTSVVAVQGAHAGNRIVLGHRDKDAPEPAAVGAVVLYDAFGNSIHLQDGKIVVTLDDKMEIGAGATKEAARKGDAVLVDGGPTGTDAAFFVWVSAVSAAINSLAPGSISPPSGPTSVTGKINAGSGKVTITD